MHLSYEEQEDGWRGERRRGRAPSDITLLAILDTWYMHTNVSDACSCCSNGHSTPLLQRNMKEPLLFKQSKLKTGWSFWRTEQKRAIFCHLRWFEPSALEWCTPDVVMSVDVVLFQNCFLIISHLLLDQSVVGAKIGCMGANHFL